MKKALKKLMLSDLICALEGTAQNTDTAPIWLAAIELRRISPPDEAFLMVRVDIEEPIFTEHEGISFAKDF